MRITENKGPDAVVNEIINFKIMFFEIMQYRFSNTEYLENSTGEV